MADVPPNRSALVWGIFFVVTGVGFLLDRLDVWNLRARYVVPLVLIALGAAILLGGRGARASGSS